ASGTATDGSVTDTIGVTVHGVGGSSAAGNIVVTIVDDVPVAVNDLGKVTEGGALTVAAADGVLANDKSGADGWANGGNAVVGVKAGSDTTSNVTTGVNSEITGSYGKLTLHADGSYTYTANPNVSGNAQDVFTYTVKDGDGDMKSATLTINVNQFIGGGNTSDTINGGAGDDVILGDAGGTNTVIQPGKNYNIALIVDTSGSMGSASGTPGKTRMQLEIDALVNLVTSLTKGSNLGTVNVDLISFASGVKSTFEVKGLTASNLDSLVNAIKALSANGNTNYEAAFKEATNWFNAQASAQQSGGKTFENVTYFLTDGDPNTSSSGGNVMNDSINAFNSLSSKSGVYAIGVGNGVTESQLQYFDNTGDQQWVVNSYATATTLANFSNGNGWGNSSSWSVADTGSAGTGTISRTGGYMAITDTTQSAGANAYKAGSPQFTLAANDHSFATFQYRTANTGSGDLFTWKLQMLVSGVWTDVGALGTEHSLGINGNWTTITTDLLGAGTYRFVYSVDDHSANGNAAQLQIDNVTLLPAAQQGHVDIVNTADQLAMALQGGSSSTDPAPVGNDIIHGGDGNDILFGDVINTDGNVLNWASVGGRPANLPNGSGLEALKVFLTLSSADHHVPTDKDIYDYIKGHHADFNVSGDTRGGNDTLYGDGGDDILYGQGGDDKLYGGDGNDILYGGAGNDELHGGKGNDTLIGGAGDDLFVWDKGDEGTVAAPARDVILDFGLGGTDPNGKDKLDLHDLLQGEENATDLSKFLHLEKVTANGQTDTVIKISTDGHLNTDGSNFNQEITLKGVDLVGAVTDQNAMIKQLIDQGKLTLDGQH
ncbi:type I secretion C-terminal target domain-containing protein, partial [Comamonas guangdongensis]